MLSQQLEGTSRRTLEPLVVLRRIQGTRAEAHQLADFGFEMWRTSGDKVPEQVARAAFEPWPPHDD